MNKKQKIYLSISIIGLLILIVAGVGYFLNKNKEGQPSNTSIMQLPSGQNSQTIKIETYDPVMGSADAPLTVVEIADFQCPYCAAASGQNQNIVSMMQQNSASWQPSIPNLIKDYVDTGKVKLVFKQFPFLGTESDSAAEASLCAADQGKFWDFYDYLYSHQGNENSGAFSNDKLEKYASALGLDAATFNQCLSSGQHKDEVAQDKSDDAAAGVNTAPTFFIGSQKIEGAVPYSTIKSAVDSQLQGK